MSCRHCGEMLTHTFLDLGYAPPSNAYLRAEDLVRPEVHYPLKVKVCSYCWLVQTEDYANADALFTPDYAYFSSTSISWLEHAEDYVKQIIRELGLNESSNVIEVASNDGYLLKNFVSAGVPCVGIEPTTSTADAAEQFGFPIIREFFGESLGRALAAEGRQADLIVGNNVYAHVPDINDFTRGLKAALKSGGTITLEFPSLMRLIERRQFDTVYHEHFSYLSLHVVCRIFNSVGLRIWKAEELCTHGGSLRIYGCHSDDLRKVEPSVESLIEEELASGLRCLQTYLKFQSQIDEIKDDLLIFLIEQKRAGKKVAAYGAAAKGNTLLNYAGVKSDFLSFVCDAAPAKQGKYLPGSHIPILPPTVLVTSPLDCLLVLPWNIAKEIKQQNASLASRGTRFITAIPNLKNI